MLSHICVRSSQIAPPHRLMNFVVYSTPTLVKMLDMSKLPLYWAHSPLYWSHHPANRLWRDGDLSQSPLRIPPFINRRPSKDFTNGNSTLWHMLRMNGSPSLHGIPPLLLFCNPVRREHTGSSSVLHPRSGISRIHCVKQDDRSLSVFPDISFLWNRKGSCS